MHFLDSKLQNFKEISKKNVAILLYFKWNVEINATDTRNRRKRSNVSRLVWNWIHRDSNRIDDVLCTYTVVEEKKHVT